MLQILPVIEESSLEFWMSRLSIFDLHAAGFEMQTWTTRTLQWCKKLCQGNYTLPEFCKMYISDHFQNFIGFYRPISWLIRCFFFPDIFQHIFFSAARWAASQTTRPPSRWFSTQPDETSGFVAAVIRNSLQSSPEKKNMDLELDLKNLILEISTCGKAKHWENACLLFASMPQKRLQPDIKSFNTAMSACGNSWQWQQAISYLVAMPAAHIRPSVISYGGAISSCQKGGQWQQALSLFDTMQRKGVQANVITYSTVISAFEKGGQWFQALRILVEMDMVQVQPDVICFNAAVSALEKGSQWQQASSRFVPKKDE